VNAEAIARAFGLRRSGREYTGTCPSCGYKTGFSVTERDGTLLLYCAAGGCEQQDLWAALRKAGLASECEPPERPRPTKRKPQPVADLDDKEAAVAALWRRSQPIGGTAAERYLRAARGYTGPIPSSVLRLAYGRHPSRDGWHPMLVAAVVLEGRLDQCVALHRIFLKPDGSGKAELEPDKMSLGPCKGGAVPLAPAGPVLAISEGIETALSYQQVTRVPTWAALSAGGVRSLVLPAEVKEVIIAADPDIPGIRAAHEAARRWLAEGRKVSIARPPEGRDFNDLLLRAS
jgi:putative DNA primase/helicase